MRVWYPRLEWGPEKKTFDMLKQACCSTPVLGFADYTKAFTLHMDASIEGIGAVLHLEDNGVKHVIAYASQGCHNLRETTPFIKLSF